MKKLFFAALLPALAFGDCASLMSKYDAPEPSSKTMKQLERWVNQKVSDANDASTLKECLVSRAADNPNQVSVAGK